jgi:hypothetical protein
VCGRLEPEQVDGVHWREHLAARPAVYLAAGELDTAASECRFVPVLLQMFLESALRDLLALGCMRNWNPRQIVASKEVPQEAGSL